MKLLLAALMCILLTTCACAMDVTTDPGNTFAVQGPVDNFTNWAVSNGATTTGWFETFEFGGNWYSGVNDTDASAGLTIPFNFDRPLSTARLDYGAVTGSYGSNWGNVDLYVTVDGVEYRIFHLKGDGGLPQYNYTVTQTPAGGPGPWRGYTDITNLVKGKTSFSLRIELRTGWSYYKSNGGQFLPNYWADSDFRLTGTVEPVAVGADRGVHLNVPVSSFTTWATGRGAVSTGFETFVSGGKSYSGTSAASNTSTLDVPFDFSAPIKRLVLDYGAICKSSGSNDGYVKIELAARDGATTRIFEMDSDRGQPNYNFTASQTPSEAGGSWRGYTDITPLVVGKRGFKLKITTATGASADVTNGGQFLPEDFADSDFHLSGYVDPDYVPINQDSTFVVHAPLDQFTNWGLSHGGVSDRFTTFLNNGVWVSGRNDVAENWAYFDLPFEFSRPIQTARVDYGAICGRYGSNWGWAQLDVVKPNGVSTRIFFMHADGGGPNYNYTTSQTPLETADTWYGYTDISDIVRGEYGFTLHFSVHNGWSGNYYNGGAFLPSWNGSDFYLTGKVGPAPIQIGLDNKFSVRGPVDDFADWAANMGATNSRFSTFQTSGTWVSGRGATDDWAYLDIPFALQRPIVSSRLDYGAVCLGYGSNWGWAKASVETPALATTRIFEMDSDRGLPDYNYTISQKPEDNSGWWRGYTDLTGLVAGQQSLTLHLAMLSGWSGYLINGGCFLPSGFPDSDFYFTGEVAPPASVPVNPDNTFSVRGPVADFTKWAVAQGGVPSEDFTTFSNGGAILSGQKWPDRYAFMSIPFNFSKSLETLRLDYGAACFKYGSNSGHVKVDVEADGVRTTIFYMDADAGATNYNYTATQTPSEDGGFWRGYTDISGLVGGKSSFIVHIEVLTGWSSWSYNGGQFLPNNAPDSDFIVSGTLQGEKTTLNEAKKKQDDSPVSLEDAIVTAAFTGYFYMESADRHMGIRVNKAGHGLVPGAKRSVVGTIQTNTDGERYVEAASVLGSATGTILPLAMKNKALGGGDYFYSVVSSGPPAVYQGQKGVVNGTGLNNIGLLVKTSGTLTYESETVFYVNDGSGEVVKCIVPSGVYVPHWLYSYGVVTGVVSCEKVGTDLLRVIRLRYDTDFDGVL